MSHSPIFIHDDQIAVNMAVIKKNGLPYRIDQESLFCKFGFIMPVDSKSFGMIDSLNDVKFPYNIPVNNCLLLTRTNTVYECASTSPDADIIRSISIIPESTQLNHRCWNGITEERIELAIQYGHDTIPKLLEVLGEYTHLNVKSYKIFSRSDIVKELERRKTLNNISIYLNSKVAEKKESRVSIC